ncbi:MAG: XrtA/PEP-CTERM system TPR-repeat protein PrsT [Burkholderiales bacterium]
MATHSNSLVRNAGQCALIRIIATSLFALCLVACLDKSADDYVASAKRYVAKKDNAAATIELRNAIQKAPKHAEARFLIGTMLLEQGAPGTAVVEIRRAIELGRDGDDARLALATALFRAGNAAELISEFASRTFSEPEKDTALRMLLGNAYLVRGAKNEALSAFDRVLGSDPNHEGALLGQARIKASEKNFSEAMRLTESILARSPTLPDALFLKAELLGAQADADGALRTLDALVQAEPRHVPGLLARVQIHLTRENLERAETALGALKAVAPTDPRTLYMQSLFLFRQGKLAEASESIAKVLSAAPDHGPSVLLAGFVAHQLRDYPTAESHLRKIVSQSPDAVMPRRVLAAVFLESGQPERVFETVRPLLEANDANAHGLVGEAHLAMGDKDRALESLQRSSKLDPKSPRVMMKLGETRLALGELDRAIDHLEAASTADHGEFRADLLLVANHLKRGDLPRALKAAAILEKKQPGNPLTHTLIADIQFAAGEAAMARQRLDRALELKSDFVPALTGLTKLDSLDGRLDVAKGRYEAVLKRFPTNDGAWLGLAEVLGATGVRPVRLVATLEKGVAASPSSIRLHVALVQTHLRAGDTRGALAAGRRADARFKDDPVVLEALGLAEKAAGEGELAIATFGRLAAMRPNAVTPLIRLAEAQLAVKDTARALASAEKAINAAPDLLDAHRLRALILIELGRKNDALAAVRALQKRAPAQPVGYMMEGEIASGLKDWPAAETAFRKAFSARKSIETVTALHGTLERAGKHGEAEVVARQWLKEHPKDVALRTGIGQRALAERNYDGAAEAYRAVLVHQPRNAIVWNNLAWVAMQQGDARAIEYAERALAIAPESPQIKDTLGMILAGKGESKRAVTLLREAATEAPDLFGIRLNLAKTLLKTGEKESARKELEALAKQNTHVQSREEAKEILSRI